MTVADVNSVPRILYIGKFDLPYRTERYVTYALRHIGCDVTTQDVDKANDNSLSEQRNFVRTINPDIVLFSKASPNWTSMFINWCREKRNPIRTVTWLWDLFWGYRPKPPKQFHADYLFTTDGGHLEHWQNNGFGHHQVLRQGIHLPEAQLIKKSSQQPWTYDVAFVGMSGSYRFRSQLVSWLRQTYGDRFRHYTTTRGMDLNRELSRVKVVVGDSYPSDNYWSNRIYEITGRGGFLLHPEVRGLDQEYEDGTHIVKYARPDKCSHRKKGFDSLKSLIDQCVRDNKTREIIRVQGFEHTRDNYSYLERCRELIRLVETTKSTYKVRT